MTELAYMLREDWAQDGTAMDPQCTVIREWIGGMLPLLATTSLETYRDPNSADREVVEHLLGEPPSADVVSFADLRELRGDGETMDACLVAIHPHEERHSELLREVIAAGRLSRVLVIVWSPSDLIRPMLDGLGAIDLHIGEAAPAPDPVQLEAAKLMVREQYNGLGSSRGKDTVVGLIRAFTAAGYPLEVDTWLRGFFAAGGQVDEAEKVRKLLVEVQKGVRHRVRPRYRRSIVEILRERVAEEA